MRFVTPKPRLLGKVGVLKFVIFTNQRGLLYFVTKNFSKYEKNILLERMIAQVQLDLT